MQCDHNCFHCKFDDCMNDDITDQELIEIELDQNRKRRPSNYDHLYYMKNRDKILDRQKRYYRETKDTVRADYLERNKEKLKAYKHEYYLAHKEIWRKKQ